MAQRLRTSEYRAIAFSLISMYVLLATIVAVQAVEFASTADQGGMFVRLSGVITYLNPFLIIGSL